jgi:hypothetical protein
VSAVLTWAIKQSFLRYVESAGGNISLAPPARWESERFVFSSNGRSETQDEIQFTFDGELAISAYSGLLDVQIADLALVLKGDQGILSAATLLRSHRYSLAKLSRRFTTHSTGPVECDAVLHDDAIGVFGGVYPSGTALDSVTISRELFE